MTIKQHDISTMPREELIEEIKAWRSKFEREVNARVATRCKEIQEEMNEQNTFLIEAARAAVSGEVRRIAEEVIKDSTPNPFKKKHLRDLSSNWSLEYHLENVKRELAS